nr:reverse transcriptase domain-containing protein [Tanacetum cinerariifolium]
MIRLSLTLLMRSSSMNSLTSYLHQSELMSVLNSEIRENLSTTLVNLPIEDDHSPLLAYVVWIFVAYLTYLVIPPYLHPFENENTIFDPGITINHFYLLNLIGMELSRNSILTVRIVRPGRTSSMMLFGHSVPLTRLQSDVLHISWFTKKLVIFVLNWSTRPTCHQAYENSLIYKEKTKRLHDSKIKNRIFNIGDRVLLFNSRLTIFSGKLKSRWSGPFTISQVYPYSTVELSQPDGPNFKVNGHRLKHYFGEDVPKLKNPLLKHLVFEEPELGRQEPGKLVVRKPGVDKQEENQEVEFD